MLPLLQLQSWSGRVFLPKHKHQELRMVRVLVTRVNNPVQQGATYRLPIAGLSEHQPHDTTVIVLQNQRTLALQLLERISTPS